MSAQHTPEPWRVENKNVGIADTGDYDGLTEIIANGRKLPVAQCWNGEEEDAENFRRIVACVNACAGMSTEQLELGGIGWLEMAPTYAQAIEQRNELLEVLRRANHILAELTFTDWVAPVDAASKDMRQRVMNAHHKAHDAIAKVEGEKA